MRMFRYTDVLVCSRGVATGGIWVYNYTLPKSGQVSFLWGNNDVRTVIEHFIPFHQKTFIRYTSPKQISGYAPGMQPEILRKPDIVKQ